MVFQNYALYPHMTVEQNLGFGLRLRKTPKAELKQRVDDAAKILGLDPLMQRKPARALGWAAPAGRDGTGDGARAPSVPDGRATVEPRREAPCADARPARALHERLATTTVYVTHDQVEAMTLGQRVAVLKDGVLQQVDTPQHLYTHPANLFVAAFIGSPPMNLVEARVAGTAVVRRIDIAIGAGPTCRRTEGGA